MIDPGSTLTWDVAAARSAAAAHLWHTGALWAHVQGVGALGESWLATGRVPGRVAVAAWLLEIGHGPLVRDTGFPPLDGARFLDAVRAPACVVSLVAYHSGARAEAEERGLARELSQFRQPPPADLDLLTLLELSVGSSGQPMEPERRLAEVVVDHDPVGRRAVERSRNDLLAAVARAAARVGV